MIDKPLPSLASLRAFESVARHGSFKEASKELFVTPGALSQLVKKLEQELDTELFTRERRHIQLTSDGEELSLCLREVFVSLKESVARVRERGRKKALISAPASLVSKCFVRDLSSVREDNPNTDIKFVAHYDMSLSVKNAADIVVSFKPIDGRGYQQICRMAETYIIVASSDFAKRLNWDSPDVLNSCSLISYSFFNKSVFSPEWHNVFEFFGLEIDTNCAELNFGESIELAIEACANGAGLVIAPKAMVIEGIKQNHLVQVLEQYQVVSSDSYFLYGLTDKQDSPEITYLLGWIKDKLICEETDQF